MDICISCLLPYFIWHVRLLLIAGRTKWTAPSAILCRRAVTDILRVSLEPPEHLSAFGPVVDGIVISKEPSLLMEDHGASFYKNYEMLVGVARVEVSVMRGKCQNEVL